MENSLLSRQVKEEDKCEKKVDRKKTQTKAFRPESMILLSALVVYESVNLETVLGITDGRSLGPCMPR